MPPTTLATTLTSERREFASTSACSSLTTAGSNADFATAWPLDSTRTMNASGKRNSEWRFPTIRKQTAARPKQPIAISVRRPARLRSSAGPMIGPTTANGAIVSSR